MGYIRVDTVDNGQQIIDAKRVLNVNLDTNGDYIEFILGFFNSSPNQPSQLRLNAVTTGSLDSDTLIQYNDAVVSAQSIFVVDLTPVTGQELQSLNYNPNP